MTEVGLPERERNAIAALVAAGLHGVTYENIEREAAATGRDFDDLAVARLNDGILEPVFNAHGWAGLFEVAYTCMEIIAAQLYRTPGSPLRFMGTENLPASAAVEQFGTALMADDRFAARLIFDGLQPDQDTGAPTNAMINFLLELLSCAAKQQNGGTLKVDMGPGSRWPPVCDFCCGPPARWMWVCVKAGLRIETYAEGSAEFGHADPNWYACNRCRADIEAHPSQWRKVYNRLKVNKPQTGEFHEYRDTLWASYELARTHRKAVRLPAQRPTQRDDVTTPQVALLVRERPPRRRGGPATR